MGRSNPNFLNGVPELLLLSALQRESLYGYELVQRLKDKQSGILDFGEGCLYPILHRLCRDGVLSTYNEKVNGRTRKYYKITSVGNARLARLQREWEAVSTAVTLKLSEAHA